MLCCCLWQFKFNSVIINEILCSRTLSCDFTTLAKNNEWLELHCVAVQSHSVIWERHAHRKPILSAVYTLNTRCEWVSGTAWWNCVSDVKRILLDEGWRRPSSSFWSRELLHRTESRSHRSFIKHQRMIVWILHRTNTTRQPNAGWF